MIKLTDAISKRFPQGNDWATEALDALSDEFDSTTLVHDVAEGWMRRGAGVSTELIDTLFILTNDRLGLGRTDAGGTEPRWIDLASVVAVDAVDDSPLPLQTIELELADGQILCVGWPETFSERLVPVLVAIAEGAELDEDVDTMPRELTDPTTLHDDASDLESLSPSEWVEGAVAVDDGTGPVAERASTPAPEPEGPAPRKVVAALDFFNPAPAPEPALAPEPEIPAIEFEPVTEDPFAVDRSAADPWTSLAGVDDSQPLAPDAFDAPFESVPFDSAPLAEPAGPSDVFDPAALGDWMKEPEEPASPQRDAAVVAGPPPWQAPGMVWPDPLRGVLYLGGHPGHPRKRKNGTMIFSPKGLEVNGSGFQSWEMNMDWAFLHGMEIQGPDEIMFGDHLKIDSTSSALIVTMVDETRMFFEIRTRRPPSLRAALAPVLLMVENIRTHRANS